MKKVCLMITGQMRTYEECFNNILENLILSNNEYVFDIYILTEFYGKNGGTPKNKFINQTNGIIDFRNNINKIYGHYLKSLIVENDSNKIDYPEYLNNYGPWLCLYKNKKLLDSVQNFQDYDIFIRTRPDIIISDKINLNSLTEKNKIYIVNGIQTRINSWLHNRDWDHMCISNLDGMRIWCDYYKFLEANPPQNFFDEIRFNNKGYWKKTELTDKSIVATQLFFRNVIEEKYSLNFDTNNVFTILMR